MMTAEKSFYHYVLYIKGNCRAIQTLEKTIIPVMARVGWGGGLNRNYRFHYGLPVNPPPLTV